MNSVGTLFGDLLQLNLPLDYYNSYVRRVAALEVADIESAARSILCANRMLWMVVADRATVESPLRELGIGEIVSATV